MEPPPTKEEPAVGLVKLTSAAVRETTDARRDK
jgi:hypothetical protein